MREYDRYMNLLYIREWNHHAHQVMWNHSDDFGHHNHEEVPGSIIKVTADDKLRLFKIPDLHDPK